MSVFSLLLTIKSALILVFIIRIDKVWCQMEQDIIVSIYLELCLPVSSCDSGAAQAEDMPDIGEISH